MRSKKRKQKRKENKLAPFRCQLMFYAVWSGEAGTLPVQGNYAAKTVHGPVRRVERRKSSCSADAKISERNNILFY